MRSRTPIKTNLCSRIRPDGGRDHYSYFSDNIFVKDNLTIKKIKSNEKYELVKPADNILRWVRLGLKDKNVQKALRLYGMGNLDWVNLYRLYEVIEDDLNRYSSKNVVQRGWATQKSIKRFKHTANSPGAIGDDSRHGKEYTKPPKNPMSLNEAHTLVEFIFHNWLRYKDSIQ
ncbi:MAG TPA: hypothetical protein GX708_10445 [Gallicola sp.]|jgi:hypothetical protein|nr:hypothetical protein [Gallicola sp.]